MAGEPSSAKDGAASPGEREARKRASRAARVAATVVFGLAVIALVREGPDATRDDIGTKTKTTTKTTKKPPKPTVTETTTETERDNPGDDDSLVSRAVGSEAAAIVLQFLLAGIAGFGAGALVQRVWLGEYGITVGPVSLPALAPISEETAAKAVDLVQESPEFAQILAPGPRGPQPIPQFVGIEDERLALLSVRAELEQRLADLALAVGLDRDIRVAKLPGRLAELGVIDSNAARGLEQLLAIGDRLVAGAEIEPEAAQKLREQASGVLYALGELRRRTEEERVND